MERYIESIGKYTKPICLEDILCENSKLKEENHTLKENVKFYKDQNEGFLKLNEKLHAESAVHKENDRLKEENIELTKKICAIKEWVKKSPYNFSCYRRLSVECTQLAKWICDFPLTEKDMRD